MSTNRRRFCHSGFKNKKFLEIGELSPTKEFMLQIDEFFALG